MAGYIARSVNDFQIKNILLTHSARRMLDDMYGPGRNLEEVLAHNDGPKPLLAVEITYKYLSAMDTVKYLRSPASIA